MLLSLSSHNVIQYLYDAGLCSSEDGAAYESELPTNSHGEISLLVNLADNCQILVQQEHHSNYQQPSHDFFNAWLFEQLLQQFPVLGNIAAIASSLLHFDQDNSILVYRYFPEYLALGKFYESQDIFPQEIADVIGNTLAALHRATFQKREYRDFMDTTPAGLFRYNFYNPAQGVESISPEIFGMVPTNALQFYVLYQNYDSLESAIADLASVWHPCCLTHNHLNLNNILVHSRWQQLDNCLVHLTNWKSCAWGDPAFELGNILASYLGIWLSSLVVDSTIELEESLHLAIIPLEVIRPSMLGLIRSYLQNFPVILDYRPDFMVRVLQFTGLVLIHQVQDMMKSQKLFDNTDLCLLQVAKNLLTRPESAVLSILGVSLSEILQPIATANKSEPWKNEPQLIPIFPEKTRLRGC